MKIDRLIGIVMLLLQEDKVTAPELAKRFEVSRRTINRDIEDICKAGIPLVTTQGFGGGISIARQYKVNKAFLTKEEMLAVSAGLKGMDSISKNTYFAELMNKLGRGREENTETEIIMIDLSAHGRDPLVEKIAEIKKAITEKREISFRYYYQKGENERIIEPYRLVFRWSAWYVLGYCTRRKDWRLFKLNRLWNLRILERGYEVRRIPEDKLDFEKYFETESEFFLKAIFAESERYRLIEEYGIECCELRQDGRLYFECKFVNYENLKEWVFSFGDKVEILEPEILEKERIRQATRIISKKFIEKDK